MFRSVVCTAILCFDSASTLRAQVSLKQHYQNSSSTINMSDRAGCHFWHRKHFLIHKYNFHNFGLFFFSLAEETVQFQSKQTCRPKQCCSSCVLHTPYFLQLRYHSISRQTKTCRFWGICGPRTSLVSNACSRWRICSREFVSECTPSVTPFVDYLVSGGTS